MHPHGYMLFTNLRIIHLFTELEVHFPWFKNGNSVSSWGSDLSSRRCGGQMEVLFKGTVDNIAT